MSPSTSNPLLHKPLADATGERSTGDQVRKPSRKPIREATAEESKRSDQGTESKFGRQSTVLVRKRLPWLDGPQQSKPGQIPGHFESTDSLTVGDAHSSPPPIPTKDVARNRASASSLSKDPALRAIGSTPSLRKQAKSSAFKSLSLSSEPRPGIKPVSSRKDARRALNMVNEQKHDTSYPSSEYSATPSTDREPMPVTLPKNDPSSYHRLVEKRTSTSPGSREPFRVDNQWLQSQLYLPLDNDISPGHSPNARQDHNRYDARPRKHHRRTSSCRSCDQSPPLREPPKAKTLRRKSRSFAAAPTEPGLPPPPSPPTRKPTLFAMPSHLLPSPSSSSHDHTPQVHQTRSPTMPKATMPPQSPHPGVEVRPKSQSLNRAVSGLETLMEEALAVARNAAHNGRNDEVANILDSATLALRKASTVRGAMGAGRMSHPLVLSPAVSKRGSESDSSSSASDASSVRGTKHSMETLPTLPTASAQSSKQPLIDSQSKAAGRSSISLQSISSTPPRLYQPPSADSIVRDFAYARAKTARAEAAGQLSKSYGAASDYYNDTGQSIGTQPGVRPSISVPIIIDKPLPPLPAPIKRPSMPVANDFVPPKGSKQVLYVRQLEPVPTNAIPPRRSSKSYEKLPGVNERPRKRRPRRYQRPHISDFFESAYYHQEPKNDRGVAEPDTKLPRESTETRYDSIIEKRESVSKSSTRYSDPPPVLQRNFSLRHPRRKHISLREGQGFSLGRYHKRQPIAREWSTHRKRITATFACMNTVFVGLITGIYVSPLLLLAMKVLMTTGWRSTADPVSTCRYPAPSHTWQCCVSFIGMHVNRLTDKYSLFMCLGVTTLIFWPLPLLHGRKIYTLVAFALMLPLMFPQALAVSGYRNPANPIYRCGLLIPRAFTGIAMGFANINFLPTLFDLFGASLMSDKPHQEIVVYDDVRRQGGGIGVWLGIWSFCFVGSMSIGFCVGAVIISALSPAWGFYIVVILLAFFLLVNVVAPETRRAPYRRSIAQYVDEDEKLKRRVARGEVKLHISNDGPKWWFQEVGAGLILTWRMILQPGFFILAAYLAWMYAQVTLVILVRYMPLSSPPNADRIVVPRRSPLTRLPMATTLRRPSSSLSRNRRLPSSTTIKSEPLQQITRQASAH